MIEFEKGLIKTANGVMQDIDKYQSKPCRLILKIKYKSEQDWLDNELWISPPWVTKNIWEKCALYIQNQCNIAFEFLKAYPILEEARIIEIIKL